MFEKIISLYYSIVPYEYRPGQLWYKFTCKYWHKYTTVKSKHLHHGWVDRCDLLPYTMFQILDDFMEKERAGSNVDWFNSSQFHDLAFKELTRIYTWWNQVYIPWVEKDNQSTVECPELTFKQIDGSNHYECVWVYKCPDHEKQWRECRERQEQLELKMKAQLKSNMITLCQYHEYLWT